MGEEALPAAATGTGTWTFTYSTAGLSPGSYTLSVQAKDSDGAFSDALALTLQVL